MKDAVDIVLFFLIIRRSWDLQRGNRKASTWNELAGALFAAVGKKPNIQYIEMPAGLEKRYQYFTQADMAKLRKSGYTKAFTPLKEAVADYGRYLKSIGTDLLRPEAGATS